MKKINSAKIKEIEEEISISIAIASTGGTKPSDYAKELLRKYAYGEIDIEMAKDLIKKKYTNKKTSYRGLLYLFD